MADDYSDIGFQIHDEADFSALHAAYPEMLTRRKNIYGEAVELFSPDGRAELWYYADEDGAFGDYAEPGYHSGHSTEVVPQEWLPHREDIYGNAAELSDTDDYAELWFYDADESSVCGRYAVLRDPSGRSMEEAPQKWFPGAMLEVETDICPLTVAVPGAFLKPLELGKPCPMELTLFARNLAVYENADDYMVRRKGSTAPESIIPFGSFSLSGKKEGYEPDPVADVSGVVTEVTLRENPVHRGRYYEIGLSCLGVDFTVVADAELLPTPPQAGNILKGFYWVSGRISD